jgi:hypothetical protein
LHEIVLQFLDSLRLHGRPLQSATIVRDVARRAEDPLLQGQALDGISILGFVEAKIIGVGAQQERKPLPCASRLQLLMIRFLTHKFGAVFLGSYFG